MAGGAVTAPISLKRLSSELTKLTEGLLSVLSVRHLGVSSLKPGAMPTSGVSMNKPDLMVVFRPSVGATQPPPSHGSAHGARPPSHSS